MTLNWKPVVLSLLQHLETQGLVPHSVCYDEERIDTWSADPSDRRNEVAEEICAVDGARLACESGPYVANLYLVLGNEPEELVADWSCTRDPVFEQRVVDALDSFEDEWSGVPCPSTQD